MFYLRNPLTRNRGNSVTVLFTRARTNFCHCNYSFFIKGWYLRLHGFTKQTVTKFAGVYVMSPRESGTVPVKKWHYFWSCTLCLLKLTQSVGPVLFLSGPVVNGVSILSKSRCCIRIILTLRRINCQNSGKFERFKEIHVIFKSQMTVFPQRFS